MVCSSIAFRASSHSCDRRGTHRGSMRVDDLPPERHSGCYRGRYHRYIDVDLCRRLPARWTKGRGARSVGLSDGVLSLFRQTGIAVPVFGILAGT